MKNNKLITLFIFFCLCLSNCQNIKKVENSSVLDSLNLLLQKDSINISLLNLRAKYYFENNQLNLAKYDIDNAYKIFKNDADILLNRGNIYFQLNQTRVSKQSWERCLNLNPNNLDCREKLVNLLCAVQDPKCKSMIDTLIVFQNGLIRNSFIVYLKEMKEYELAIELLNNSLNTNAKDKESLMMLSILYSDTSSMNQKFNSNLAEEYFERIINIYPSDPQVYYNYGKFRQNINQYEEAIALYLKGLEFSEKPKYNYYNMGFCAMQLGDNLDAIDYFSKSLQMDQSFLLAYHARAYVHELMNQKEKANTDWKNCLMLNPSYIPALEALSD
ncbi:MAG: hypothetical protein CMP49_03660 [Flavobacteriales bacterium]|nr:hypothetical protein [Flavobacteriales bacterium]